MPDATPLLVLLDALRVEQHERDAFTSDPDGYLAAHGWGDLDPLDVRDAILIVREGLPIDVAVTIPDHVDGFADYVQAVDVPLDVEDFGADAAPVTYGESIDLLDADELDAFAAAAVYDVVDSFAGPSADDDDTDEDEDDGWDPADV